MQVKRVSLVVAGFACLVPAMSSLGYGSLSQFVNSARTVLRTSTIYSSDLIVDPVWPSSALPLRLTLCNGGAQYTSAAIKYQTTKDSELLSDISAAQTAWSASLTSGSTLSFLSPDSNASCTGSDTSVHEIRFSNDPGSTSNPGVLAYTVLDYTFDGSANLVMSEGHIEFNSTSTIHFVTQACLTAGSASGTCSRNSDEYSFLGVLTHELGHLLGLSHVPLSDDNASDGSNTVSTMIPSIQNLSDSRQLESLTLDDQVGLASLYPGSNAPLDLGGTVSGFVKLADGSAARGAHVTAFNLSTNRTIVGTFSGVSGSLSGGDGTYTLKGIPLDTNFAVFVEPVHRTDFASYLAYYVYNAPIQAALESETYGYRFFAIEAYPDVQVPDVRKYGDATLSPTFASAQVFRLTNASPTATGVNFYLSNQFQAPNDALYATLRFNSNVTISDSNPLTLTLSIPTQLSIFSTPSVSLVARKSDESSDRNWAAGLTDFTYSGTSSTITVDASSLSIPDGTYTVTATLTDSKYGEVEGSTTITVSGWTGQAAGTENSGGGGGGCQLNAARTLEDRFGFIMIIMAAAFSLRQLRRYHRKSSTSFASILSKPKIS